MSKAWKGFGGLWFNQAIKKASDAGPRWKGSYTCECGKVNKLEGFGSDQMRSKSANAPTIKLRRASR